MNDYSILETASTVIDVNVSLTWVNIATLIIAGLAFLQPWIIQFIIWLRDRNRSKVIIEPAESMSIGFDERGLYINVIVTFIPMSIETVVRTVKVTISKGHDVKIELTASNFYNDCEESCTRKARIRAHSFYVGKSVPAHLMIEFSNDEIRKKVEECIEKGERDNLLRQSKLETGNYDIVFELTDVNSRQYSSKRSFSPFLLAI